MIKNSHEQVTQALLSSNGLNDAHLDKALASLLSHSIDGGDLYFQLSQHESWALEDGIVKNGSFNIDQGVGVRAISGEKTGFSYAENISDDALFSATKAARSIAKVGQQQSHKILAAKSSPALYQAINPIDTLSDKEKIALLEKADAVARAEDSRVKQVFANLSSVYEQVLVVATDGTLASDIRPLVRLNVSVIVEENGRREQASSGGGGRYSLQNFIDEDSVVAYAKEAVRQALVNLQAIPAPAGAMPIVLGSGWPGVLLHEAVGHGLEGDFNRKGSSTYSGCIGQQVASPLVTVVDNGTIENRRGSLSVDDEGTPTQNNVLIENGVLKNYMQDKMNAKLMGVAPTGNGRRESYAHLPMPRMTNTYMLAGDSEQAELIASVDKGIYAANFGGGQVDITSGKFVFSASEAYLIENGKITTPVKGATLIGNGPDVMNKISMVGNDLALDTGVGVCGKEGQSVPVGVGQPSLKIDEITVGGTAL